MRRPLCLFALLCALSVWMSVTLFPPADTVDERIDGKYVTLSGTVEWKEYARKSEGGSSYIKLTLKGAQVERGIPDEMSVPLTPDDKILCTLEEEPQEQEAWALEGSQVRVRGKLRLYRRPSNDGEFDAFTYYREIGGYLFTLGDAHILAYTQSRDPVRSSLYALRSYLSESLDRLFIPAYGAFGEECASVMKAMLLGQSGLVEPSLKERYQAAGIIHIICISGLHISLLGTILLKLLRRTGLPAAPSSLLAAAVLILYGIMTGMHISCVRALVMFGFQAAAKALGRTYDLLTALSAAAVLLLISQPCYIYNSGFLFSFSAVIAAGTVMQSFPGAMRFAVIPLCMLSIQLSFYYTFPLYSILLNLIVLTLAPFVMTGGAAALLLEVCAGLLSVPFPGLSSFLSLPAELFASIPAAILWLFEKLCELTERLPFYTLTPGRPHSWEILLYYLLIAAAALAGEVIHGRRWKTLLAQTACIAPAVLMIFFLRFTPPLALYMLDVGQGDGICIQARGDDEDITLMIDGGSTSRKKTGEYLLIPFCKYHGISVIDQWVLTHDDLDHCSGLLEMMRLSDEPDGIRIGNIALPQIPDEAKGANYIRIEDMARAKGIGITYLCTGMVLEEGALKVQCLHPDPGSVYEDTNEYSVVLLLQYNDFSALLTGDLEGQGETDLLKSAGEGKTVTDILKVAHHGSSTATTKAFLSRFIARAALISCGKDNPYGHPAADTLRRLEEAGMAVYDTRLNGQVSVLTDGGGSFRIRTFY